MIFKCEKKQKQQIVREEKQNKNARARARPMSILAHSHCESLIKQIPLAAKEFDVEGTENWLAVCATAAATTAGAATQSNSMWWVQKRKKHFGSLIVLSHSELLR